MFTDMVGYTALGQRNESLSLALVDEQRKLIRPILSRHNGREVKTMGDAFLVEFPSALEAVRCAYDIQRATREFNISIPEERRIHLRIGVHLGDVVESQGDISGDAVNVASRIEPLADDGGVSLTRQVYDQIENKIELPMMNLGTRELKNVTKHVDVYRIVMPWEQVKVTPPPPEKRRIAVLPFANISPNLGDEYFADGMTEELINALSHVQGLRVIARTSVVRYKGSPKPVSDVARELGVGSLLEGSVRKAGDRVRVTAQLIDVATEEHLWSENYDRKVEDVFAVQSDIAERVAESMRIRLLENERNKLKTGPTSNPEAHAKYLFAKHGKGLDPFARIRYFEEAIELDPNFALAFASLAFYYVDLSGSFIPSKEALSKANEYVSKALELDSNLSEAWSARGNLAIQYDWDLGKAELCLKKALELNPSSRDAYRWYSALCLIMGRFDEAVQFATKAATLDPFPADPPDVPGIPYATARRDDEAVLEAVKLTELYPNDINARNLAALIYGLIGRTSEAVRELKELRRMIESSRKKGVKGWTGGADPVFYSFNAFGYASAGQLDQVRTMIDEAEAAEGTEYVAPFAKGLLYLSAGDKTKAFGLFEKALEDHDAGFLLFSSWHFFDAVRSDSRFLSLLKAVTR